METKLNSIQEIVIHSVFGTADYTAIIYSICNNFYQYDIVFSNNQIYESFSCYSTPECAEINCREDLHAFLSNPLKQNIEDFNLHASNPKFIK